MNDFVCCTYIVCLVLSLVHCGRPVPLEEKAAQEICVCARLLLPSTPVVSVEVQHQQREAFIACMQDVEALIETETTSYTRQKQQQLRTNIQQNVRAVCPEVYSLLEK